MNAPHPSKDSPARALRRWHLGLEAHAAPLPSDALPLLLAPFRDPTRVRNDFPLAMTTTAEGVVARSIGDALATWTAVAEAQPRALRDNLLRLERRVRTALRGKPPQPAAAALTEAAAQLVKELVLRDEIAAGLQQDLARAAAAAESAVLVPLDATTPLRLLAAAAEHACGAARARHRARVTELAAALRQRLDVEARKDPEAHGGEALQKSLGGAAVRFLDPATLARSVGAHRGTVALDPARRQRMQQTLQILDAFLDEAPAPTLCVVHGAELAAEPAADLACSRERAEDVCAAAAQRCDRDAAALLPLARACRLAELEVRAGYDVDRHDAVLAAMTVADLERDERATLPTVVAVAAAALLAASGMQSLTALLTSDRPVHVLVREAPARDAVALGCARLELGYLGVACREAFVQQATAARPAHLLRGFVAAMGCGRPALHLVDPGLGDDGRESPIGAFLQAGAAIEGRAHPLFHYDPQRGETWARRLDFAGNPSPEQDWPQSNCTRDGVERELVFTFADYALLDPHQRGCFAAVPDGIDADDLVELGALLDVDGEDERHRVPFVFVARADGSTARVAVRRVLVEACRDRRRYWRTLQELAGVKNEHVREAVQQARRDAAEQAAREREALQAQHEAALAAVRDEAAGTAMQGLARMLLELDPLGDLPSAPRAAAPVVAPRAEPTIEVPQPAEATAAKNRPAAVAEGKEEEEDAEPWIESARCSTCNDCVNLNSLLFVYDANKQARIGDPRAGSYAQLVQAAEKCPSRCIHPGLPLDPDEPDLDALIARAKPFR